MEQIYNPYLPLNEYIPDGEPHVYDGRLYIYGSHDKAQGTAYCEQHYRIWSAPEDNLKDWRDEGVSYLRTQDPSNADDELQLWAPDVTRGPDGRYYLYYCLSFYPEIGVAVSDSPAGPFSFYGHVHYPDHILGGKVLQEGMVFDPAVLTDDDGRVYLYYGFAPACEREIIFHEFTKEELSAMSEKEREKLMAMASLKVGDDSMVVELEQDMLTTKGEPKALIPGGNHAKGTDFEGHGFFEASSIRKINGKYYFVYSSHKSHELCYAISDRPDEGFVYGGILVSNGDIGLKGRKVPVYPLGNNHGGIVKAGDSYYVFYHRQTNGTEFSRQGCAEKIQIDPDGSIHQVEMTSSGLNGGPLAASGTYPAAIACHLTDPTVKNHIDYADPVMKDQVCVTQVQNQSFITRIKDDTVVGYKYFLFGHGLKEIVLELRGSFRGNLKISTDEKGNHVLGSISLKGKLAENRWNLICVPVQCTPGKHALFLRFDGEGHADFKTLAFLSEK